MQVRYRLTYRNVKRYTQGTMPGISDWKTAHAGLGIPLREYVTQAVEEKLSLGQRPGKPWLECAGELAHLHKETMRIQKIIDEEFEQIEPEDWT
jgi:hypothetical protein